MCHCINLLSHPSGRRITENRNTHCTVRERPRGEATRSAASCCRAATRKKPALACQRWHRANAQNTSLTLSNNLLGCLRMPRGSPRAARTARRLHPRTMPRAMRPRSHWRSRLATESEHRRCPRTKLHASPARSSAKRKQRLLARATPRR